MPVIHSEYHPPFWLNNRHLETIFPALFRKTPDIQGIRNRLELSDGDFLDYDVYETKTELEAPLLLLSHGLEGDSKSGYIKGMVKMALEHGYRVIAWNYRGCSGEPNRLKRFYHSGESNDLRLMVEHIISRFKPESMYLIGFSIGGNITLKYMGEEGIQLSPVIKAAATLSVPCDLASGARHLAGLKSKVYMRRFMQSLSEKIKAKSKLFPDLDAQAVDRMNNFIEFDEYYTAPLHGFDSAEDYWKKNSSKFFLPNIQRPTLLLTAANDPFLTPACYPFTIAEQSPYLFLNVTQKGGHVGFYQKHPKGYYWSEERIIEFIRQYA